MNKLIKLLLGQIVIATGIALVINSNLGAFPITLTNLSLSNMTGLSFGFCSMLVELIIISICISLKAKIGIATLFNGIFGGYFIDFILLFLPIPNIFILKLIYVLLGAIILVLGFYLQGSAGLGKTSSNLITACIRRKTGFSITKMKLIQETCFTLFGLLAASSSFGLATIILSLGFGYIMDKCYKVIKYDPTKVNHKYLF